MTSSGHVAFYPAFAQIEGRGVFPSQKTAKEIWFHCWREIRDGIWWQTKLEAPGGYRRLLEAPGGDLKWATAKHWVSESRVGQCLGAPWDALNSRYVPYFTIRSQFWAVQARKEKFPPLKDSGLPPDFHKKSGGEPVYSGTCVALPFNINAWLIILWCTQAHSLSLVSAKLTKI